MLSFLKTLLVVLALAVVIAIAADFTGQSNLQRSIQAATTELVEIAQLPDAAQTDSYTAAADSLTQARLCYDQRDWANGARHIECFKVNMVITRHGGKASVEDILAEMQ